MRCLPNSWISTFTKLGIRKSKRRTKRLSYYRRRPTIESLESRQLLSITVNTLVDENDGINVGGISLRDAVAYAASQPGNDRIEFASSLVDGAIELLYGQITLDSDVEIIGLGQNKLTIDASGASRIFQVNSSVVAAIEDLTISGGQVTGTSDGGAIHNSGYLTLKSVVITNNHSADHGGAIYNHLGTVCLVDSTLSLNTAAVGGAISSKSDAIDSIVIEGSSIILNEASNNAGGIRLDDVSDMSGPSARIINSTFSGNISMGAAGAVQTTPCIALAVINSTITANTAATVGGGVRTSGGIVTLHNTILAGNAAGVAGKEVSWFSVKWNFDRLAIAS
jgi:predicted outer membrane repeat protein